MQSAFSWSAPRSPAIDQGRVAFAAKQAGQEGFTTENTEFHGAPRRSKAVSGSTQTGDDRYNHRPEAVAFPGLKLAAKGRGKPHRHQANRWAEQSIRFECHGRLRTCRMHTRLELLINYSQWVMLNSALDGAINHEISEPLSERQDGDPRQIERFASLGRPTFSPRMCKSGRAWPGHDGEGKVWPNSPSLIPYCDAPGSKLNLAAPREAEAPESAPGEAPIFPPRRFHSISGSSVSIPCFRAGAQPLRSNGAGMTSPTTTVPAAGQRGEPTP